MAGRTSEPQTAPIWLPVWRTENTKARRSAVTSRASSAALAGVSGPKARPRQSPAASRAALDPNEASAMLATTAAAHRLAIRSEPRRAMRPPPQNEAGTPTANTAHGEHRELPDLDMGARRDHARREQRQRHQRLQRGHRPQGRQQCGALAERRCLRLPWRRARGRNSRVAGGISIHAVDVASGRPAQGLRVEIWRIEPEPCASPTAGLAPMACSTIPSPRRGRDGRRVRSAVSSRRILWRTAPASSTVRRSASGSRAWTSIFICR